MDLTIGYLADYPEHVQTVIDWLFKEFGGAYTRPFFGSIVRHSLKKGSLPLTFLALADRSPAGTVGLWRADLLSRQDLSPWLAALFVRPEYRGNHIGGRLQEFLADFCKQQGYGELYLYTQLNGYYEKTGWDCLGGGCESNGDPVKIYGRKL